MRMYFFNNHYLGPMQHGIQAAHCLGEVTLRFSDPTDPVHAQLRQLSIRLTCFNQESIPD